MANGNGDARPEEWALHVGNSSGNWQTIMRSLFPAESNPATGRKRRLRGRNSRSIGFPSSPPGGEFLTEKATTFSGRRRGAKRGDGRETVPPIRKIFVFSLQGYPS
jgi:hypothetical protein